MKENSYDSGRLNLPFVGLCSFGKYPYQPDWNAIDADFAILGAPYDFGTQYRAGARFGPRSIREASTLFSFGHAGACLLYTSPSPRDISGSRMPSSA